MTPFDSMAHPTLTTDRLILREVVMADADDLLRFRGDAEVQQYNLVPMKTRAEAVNLVRTMQTWFLTRYALQWGITLRDEGTVIGLCGLHEWNRQHRRALVGYDLTRSYWGQGIAYEAVSAVIKFGFEQWDLNRIEAITITDNARSVRLLGRLGFQLEGVRREFSWQDDDRFHGSAVYSLLRSDDEANQTPSACGRDQTPLP